MRPHQARRLAKGLWVSSFVAGILSLTLTLHFLGEWHFAKPEKSDTGISVAPLRQRPVVRPKTLEEYKTIATVPILEDVPPVVLAVVRPPVKPPEPPPVALPLTWAGVVVHSDPKKSVAFVLDKRSNKQLLLREGTVLPNSTWQVVQITNKAVVLQAGANRALVEKPKPSQVTAPNQPKIMVSGNGSLNHESTPPSTATNEDQATEESER